MNENDRNDDNGIDLSEIQPKSNKDKPSEIYSVLGISDNVFVMSKHGCTAKAIDSVKRAFERAERIIRRLAIDIYDLVSPSN